MSTANSPRPAERTMPRPVMPPEDFTRFDFYPALMLHGSEAALGAVLELHVRSDELGPCLVSFVELEGLLMFLYRSEAHPCEAWTVFVDGAESVLRGQGPVAPANELARWLGPSFHVTWRNNAAESLLGASQRPD